MRFSTASALLGLAATSSAQLIPATKPGPAPKVPIGVSKAPFSKVVGRVFEINGKVEYFAGTNTWWLAHLSKDSDVDATLSELVKTQYKITRVWGFGDVNEDDIPLSNATDPNRVWFQLLNSTGAYINYGEDGLQRLDYAVSAAEKAGIGLVLNFVNNWDSFGGIAVYNAAFGGNATSWYTDEVSQAVYRNYIKLLVDRYKSSPAIFAWELANEARCQPSCDYNIILKWATETSRYIKSLDPNHLVTTGEEGFFAAGDESANNTGAGYDGSEGTSFSHNIRIPDIDYGVFHMYPNYWGYSYEWGNLWIEQHDAVGEQVGKPVILEEYGTPFPHNHTGTEGPWQQTVLKSGLAADQIWQFGPDQRQISVPVADLGDVNSVYINDTEFQVLGFEHAAEMLAKKVPKLV